MSARTPLFDPASYFESRTEPIRGAAVFVLHAVLQLAGMYIGVALLFDQVENLDPGLEREAMSIVSGLLVVSAIFLVVGWFVVAAIVHYGSGGSRTAGSFTDALTVSGWAYAPNVAAFLPSFFYQWRRVQQLSFDGTDPAQLVTEFEAVQAEITMSPFPLLVLALATVWSVYILAYGIAETHDVPVETAAIPAIAVGVGSVLLTLLG